MRFSTPISSVATTSKGQVGVRGYVAVGVYSDLFIKKAMIGETGRVDANAMVGEFERLFKYGSAVGFSPFKSFIEGYYDYEKALFKMKISCSSPDFTPEVSKLAVIIDVPDVVEANTQRTSEKGEVWVAFKKNFYEVPTITARQLNGSDIATPIIRQNGQDFMGTDPVSGNKGFYLKLETGGGTLIEGDVHWQAIGY